MATGIGSDEGGYAYVASLWAKGETLYRQAWVDRPQGLMLAYRALLSIAHEPWAIRLGAVLAGAGVTVLVGLIGWLLAGRTTGIAAALIYAIVGVGPHIEGFTFNGELAAALPSAGAVAAALWWRRRGGVAMLVLAGALGGTAILMKQVGFDGLVVAGLVALAGQARWRVRAGRLGLVAAGAAIPLGAAVVHGLTIGWHAYLSALGGYRLSPGALPLDFRLHAFTASLPIAARDLAGPALAALIGLAALSSLARGARIPLLWLAVAVVGFVVGGDGWPHYYVQLLTPLCVLTALAVTSSRRRAVRVVLAGCAVVPVAIFLVHLALVPPAGRQRAIPYYADFEHQRALAAFVRERSSAGDRIFALPSHAAIYFLSGRRSASPYVWNQPLHLVNGGMLKLARALAGSRRPRLVVVYQRPVVVDPSGHVWRALAAHYVSEPGVPAGFPIVLRAR
jgi:hypothetical protein